MFKFVKEYDRRGFRKWTDPEIEYMKTHVSDGWDEIAKVLERTVPSILSKYNTLFPPTPVSAADITTIKKMRKQRMTYKQIAEQMGLSEQVVKRYCKDDKLIRNK